jgi:hypothetical protein
MFSATFIWEPGIYDAEFNELNALIEAVATSTPGPAGTIFKAGKRKALAGDA